MKKNIIDIFKIINQENILLIDNFSLRSFDSKGIYINIPNHPPTIGIDKDIIYYNSIYMSILSEELGHHFTTGGNLVKEPQDYSESVEKEKKELKAKKWASNFLVSDAEFVKALYDCLSNKDEMCEHFNITNELLEIKILSIIHNEEKYKKIRSEFKKKEIQYEACNI